MRCRIKGLNPSRKCLPLITTRARHPGRVPRRFTWTPDLTTPTIPALFPRAKANGALAPIWQVRCCVYTQTKKKNLLITSGISSYLENRSDSRGEGVRGSNPALSRRGSNSSLHGGKRNKKKERNGSFVFIVCRIVNALHVIILTTKIFMFFFSFSSVIICN